jgi:hypothetical protein
MGKYEENLMPISPREYAQSIINRIAEVRTSTKKGEVLDAREDAVLKDVSAHLAQIVKTRPSQEEGMADLRRIMNDAYIKEYIEGRSRSALGKTDKSKLLKLFEDKIFWVAYEVLNPNREGFERSKNSFEKDLALSITDPLTVKNIFDTALKNIVLASQEITNTRAIQDYANAMKFAERLSDAGKQQFNRYAESLGASTAKLLSVTPKSRSESELKGALTQILSNQTVKQSIISYVDAMPPPPPLMDDSIPPPPMTDDNIPPPPPREAVPPPPPMTDDDIWPPPPPPVTDDAIPPPPPRTVNDFSDAMNDPYFPPPPAGIEKPSPDNIPPPPPIEDIPPPPPSLPQSTARVPPPIPQQTSKAVPPPLPQQSTKAVPPPIPARANLSGDPKAASPTYGQGMFEKKQDAFRDELANKLKSRAEVPKADDTTPNGPKK